MADPILSKINEEILRWKEGLGLLVAALLGVIWRLGRKWESNERRLSSLETWRTCHTEEVAENKVVVDAIRDHLNLQDIDLAVIKASQLANGQVLTDVQKTLRLLISYRQPGGRRAYDEPTEAAQAEKEEEEPH
jgi:hypothetical protein